MSSQWMRCNLAAALFPFASELWGRTIIVPQYDENYDRALVATAADTEKDKGIPQAFYMHNCMPTAQGYQAIGYTKVIEKVAGEGEVVHIPAIPGHPDIPATPGSPFVPEVPGSPFVSENSVTLLVRGTATNNQYFVADMQATNVCNVNSGGGIWNTHRVPDDGAPGNILDGFGLLSELQLLDILTSTVLVHYSRNTITFPSGSAIGVPVCLGLDPDGSAYVRHGGTGQIFKCSPTAGGIAPYFTPTSDIASHGVVVDGTGKMWGIGGGDVVYRESAINYIAHTATEVATTASTANSNKAGLGFLKNACAIAGRVYFEGSSGEIRYVNTATLVCVEIVGARAGISLSSVVGDDGNIYTIDTNTLLRKYDKDGVLLATLDVVLGPADIHLYDARGILWVDGRAGGIPYKKIDPVTMTVLGIVSNTGTAPMSGNWFQVVGEPQPGVIAVNYAAEQGGYGKINIAAIPAIPAVPGVPPTPFIPAVPDVPAMDITLPAAGTVDDFDKAFLLQDISLVRFVFVPATGTNYVFDAKIGAWQSSAPFTSGVIPDNVLVTVAFVHGQSYINYSSIGTYKYNIDTKLMDPVVLAGLVDTDVKGICEANGYMIAWTDSTVAWSSIVDATDFVPSLVTGAGGGNPEDAKGRIVACLPISGGFIVYCEKNAVAAKFSGNVRFPFTFIEIAGSGGIISPENVSWTSNLATHYVWGTQGFQTVDKFSVTNLAPEVTDFLGNFFYEDFNEITKKLTTTYLTNPLFIKLTLCADRYVVISYGLAYPELTYALVYDLALKRWGKLKIDHRDCFQWETPDPSGALTYGDLIDTTYGSLINTTYGDLITNVFSPDVPKKSIAFLQKNGNVYIVNFNQDQVDANGVLILGKFQFQRNYFICHQRSTVESVRKINSFNMYLLPSLDGKTLMDAVAPMLIQNNNMSKTYGKRLTALNLSLLFMGSFNLTTVLTEFTVGGHV